MEFYIGVQRLGAAFVLDGLTSSGEAPPPIRASVRDVL